MILKSRKSTSGAVLICAGVTGQVFGGFVISKTDPSIRQQMVFIICAQICALISFFLLFYHCEETTFAGANIDYAELDKIHFRKYRENEFRLKGKNIFLKTYNFLPEFLQF